MKLKLTPPQIAWLKRVLTKRIELRNKRDKQKTAIKELTKIVDNLSKITGDTLTISRAGARLVEDACLGHIHYIESIALPALAERLKKDEGYSTTIAKFTIIKGEVIKLLKEVQGGL